MRLLILIVAFLFLKLSIARAIPEDRLREAYTGELAEFRKTGETFRFDGERGQSLAAIRFIHTNPTGTIVVLPGRSEPYLKYLEVFYDLYQEGYDVYSYDHRGQGLSPHLSSHRQQIGHIDSFDNYIRDLHTFTETQVNPRTQGPLYLLAHSMGGAIAARYLSEHPGVYAKAILVSPMLEIVTKPYPAPVARLIVAGAVRIGLGNRYAPGKGDYRYEIPIDENSVTHSETRAWLWDQVTRERPETAIGGPSNKWVLEALKGSASTRHHMDEITTPFKIFQADEDTIVKLGAQDRGCDATPACQGVEEFKGARHEILMEKDPIRDRAKDLITEFFVR